MKKLYKIVFILLFIALSTDAVAQISNTKIRYGLLVYQGIGINIERLDVQAGSAIFVRLHPNLHDVNKILTVLDMADNVVDLNSTVISGWEQTAPGLYRKEVRINGEPLLIVYDVQLRVIVIR